MQTLVKTRCKTPLNVLTAVISAWTAYAWLYIVNTPLINNERRNGHECDLLNLLTATSIVIGTISLGRAYFLAFPQTSEPRCLKNSTYYNKMQLGAGIFSSSFSAGMGGYGVSKTINELLNDQTASTYVAPISFLLSTAVFSIAQLALLIKIRVIPKKWALVASIMNAICNSMVIFQSSILVYSIPVAAIITAVTFLAVTSFYEQHLRLAKGLGDRNEQNPGDLKCQKPRALLGLVSILLFTSLAIISSHSNSMDIKNAAINASNTSIPTTHDDLSCKNLDPNLLKAMPWWFNSFTLFVGFFPLNVLVFLTKKTRGENNQSEINGSDGIVPSQEPGNH